MNEPRPLTIVTGTSRGLGLALTRRLLERGDRVLALARSDTDPGDAPRDAFTAWRADLADATAVAARLETWLGAQAATATAATLIHNAGVLATPAPLAAQAADELRDVLRVGIEAPLLLTSAFLRATAAWRVPRKVVFVSSGLGRRAMAGSAAYCAAKAGLDHLARALALEEAANEHGARVASVAPGVIETDMQRRLRGADPRLFPERERFVELARSGAVATANDAAARLIASIDREDFGANPIADVRDAAR